jgi:NTP pyrophosphatase (non-canonical NTP hydrolase)
MGYHRIQIPKGKLGEFSKISEEYLELFDAHNQENKVLEICELCDLIGAIELYANKFNLTLDDLIKMKEANKHAFEDGTRH